MTAVMNDLQAAQALLTTAMLGDPALALANVVAWLDPVALTHEAVDEDDFNDEAVSEDDTLHNALAICRRCFPEVYAQASQRIWQGTTYDTLDRRLCAGINVHLVAPLDDLELLGYGVPIDGMGVHLDEIEFYTDHPDLAAVLADFGVTAETFEADIDSAQTIASALVRYLAL